MGVLGLLWRPQELAALIKLKRKIGKWKARAAKQEKDADWVFCFDMLDKVSRSFAIVIEQLGDELRNAVCVFYLVLRGLDTVEDDMEIDLETKTRLLLNFHNSISEDGFSLSYGYKDEKLLLEKFAHVVAAFKSLRPEFQEVIRDITQRMAKGMQEFCVRDVQTTADYDLYCHYVAGLVGIGLSNLFAGSGLEDPEVSANETLSNHMGLFLQKTNIIRDFLEDHEDVNEVTGARRVFWPKEIWSEYTDDLKAFTFGKNETRAVACLNHMVTDALQHLPHSIEYLSSISNEENFRFCAIPQVMAVHTLSLCYANPDVFTGEIRKNLGECRNKQPVKIRKGLSARLMLSAEDMQSVIDIFEEATESMSDRIAPADPSATETHRALQLVRDTIARGRRCSSPSSKVVESGVSTDVLRAAQQTAEFIITPLMVLLLANALIVDVPQALGLDWRAAPSATPASSLSGALHLMSTAWGVVVYMCAAAALLMGAGTQRFSAWATIHLALCAAEAGAEVAGSAAAADVLKEAAPKVLAGVTMMVFASRVAIRELTPSHAPRSARIRAVGF